VEIFFHRGRLPAHDIAMAVFAPVLILDGQVAAACTHKVVVTLTHIPQWTDAHAARILQDLARRAGAESVNYGALSRSLGQPPGPTQRKVFADGSAQSDHKKTRNGVLVDTALERGVVTAYGWLSRRPIKAFTPGDLNEACRWVLGDITDVAQAARALEQSVLECHKLLGFDLLRSTSSSSRHA
jgi:hypothetical protein